MCSPSSGTNKIWKETEKEALMFNKKSCSNSEWLMMGLNSGLGALGISSGYKNLYKQVLKNYNKGFKNVVLDNDLFNKVHAAPINKTRKQIINYKSLNTFINPAFPILITYGENDIYGSSKENTYLRFPSAEYEVVTHSGHIPWIHNHKLFRSILIGFYSHYC
ncbi:alpha/beta fold hydrolase [Yeosuana marina]|uniref:alpha/beta fold hydrolase n=1 Tax=Yeosuana marina TaxID=1565536 RepID=UPI00374320EE